MKKLLSTLILLGLVALPAGQALAQWPGGGGGTGGEPTGWDIDIQDLLINVRGILWGAFIIFAIIMFIYAGFLFFTAGGDPEGMQKARRAAIYGVAGVAVAFVGYGIVSLVGNILGAPGYGFLLIA